MLTWDSNKQNKHVKRWINPEYDLHFLFHQALMNWHVRYFLVHYSTIISSIQFKMTSRSTYPAKESPFPFIKGLAFWPPCTWNQDIELQASKANALDMSAHWEPQDTRQGQWHFKHGLMEALHTWIHRWTWHLTQVIPVWETYRSHSGDDNKGLERKQTGEGRRLRWCGRAGLRHLRGPTFTHSHKMDTVLHSGSFYTSILKFMQTVDSCIRDPKTDFLL